MNRIKEHHRSAAREFEDWLRAHPDAMHEEIHEAFDRIEDKHYRDSKRARRERIKDRL